MCEKQDKIDKLEKELATLKGEMYEREAKLFKDLAEGRNFESQTLWRPWQVALIPIVISLIALVAAIAK